MNKIYQCLQKVPIFTVTNVFFRTSHFSTVANQEQTYSPRTANILNQIAREEGFSTPKISSYGQIGKGQGVTGDMFFVNINGVNKVVELLVKQASTNPKVRKYFPIESMYENESHFYKNIWPEYLKLQERSGNVFFDNVPWCYNADLVIDNECIVLENLKSENFVTIDKKQYMSKELLEFVIEKYGQLHALSYIYKRKQPRKYDQLISKSLPYWELAQDIVPLKVSIEDAFQKCLTYLSPSPNEKLVSKIKFYANLGFQKYLALRKYNGENGAILHGDCWSNNMMFKFYDSGRVADMKFIDFQTSKAGSVVYDISYFLYSSGSAETFANLDHYLQLYYNSLSHTCCKMGCFQYISWNDFQEEWQLYCNFGWVMAMVILRAKLIKDDAKLDLALMLNEFEKRGQKAHLEDSDEEEVEQRTLVLLEHMYRYGFL